MKYWVYKDSRILGPYDREAFAGLPGVDESTLVSVGEAGVGEGDWRLAGEVPDLAGLGLGRASWAVLGAGDIPAAQGMLDRLQIDAAGLVDDEDFPAGAQELFQDADIKKDFRDLLTPRPAEHEAELRRARDRAAELALQVEALHKRLTDLEDSRSELMHRLAEHEARARLPPALLAPAPAPSQAAAPADAPVPAPAPVSPPVAAWPVIAPPASAPAPIAAAPVSPSLPDIPALPAAGASAPAPGAPPSGWGAPVGVPGLPSLPPGAGAPTPPATPVADSTPSIVEPGPPAATSRITFSRKIFKVVPTRKTFKVIGENEAAPPSAASPPIVEAAAPLPASQPPPVVAVPTLIPPPLPQPVSLAPAPVAPAPVEPLPTLAPPATMTFTQPFAPPPVPAPEAAAPPPAPSFDDLAGAPPATMQVAGGASAAAALDAEAPSPDAVLARLAKPAAPPTAPPAPRPRSYKALYIAGALLLLVLAGIGFMFRSPKDVSELATLDDGRSRVGAEVGTDLATSAPPPAVSPVPAEPPPRAQPPAAAQPDAGSALDAAVELVKGFPLDGDRGTVGAWLQYSYAASADAGREVWSANAKGDELFLVEYKVEPAPNSGNPGVFYLFEADMTRRLVMGKNPEARQMLAGAPPPAETPAPRPKKKAKARPAAKPRPRVIPVEPKEVPLLPLPGEGELRPPAEDDGAFGSDTVGGGI